MTVNYDYNIANRVVSPLEMFEGQFAALAMLLCGCIAIVCLVLGKRRKSRLVSIIGLTFLVLSVASFLLRICVVTFFNDSCDNDSWLRLPVVDNCALLGAQVGKVPAKIELL